MQYDPGTADFLYAGEFLINTQYDDPAGNIDNLAPARNLYAAQAFAVAAVITPYDGRYPAEIRITASPTFGSIITPGSGPGQVARIWIRCVVWMKAGRSNSGDSIVLNEVSWALYQL